jgi:hypothetical protein
VTPEEEVAMYKRLVKGAVGLGLAVALLGLLGCQGNSRDDAEADVFLLLHIQDGESLAVFGNIQEVCDDVAQLLLEHRLVGGGTVEQNPYTDAILTDICMSYRNNGTGATSGPDVPDSYCFQFHELVETNGELQVFNVPVLRSEAKTNPPLDRSTGQQFPIEFTVFITAYSEQVSGEKIMPDTLQMTVIVDDDTPRDPPCPSQK